MFKMSGVLCTLGPCKASDHGLARASIAPSSLMTCALDFCGFLTLWSFNAGRLRQLCTEAGQYFVSSQPVAAHSSMCGSCMQDGYASFALGLDDGVFRAYRWRAVARAGYGFYQGAASDLKHAIRRAGPSDPIAPLEEVCHPTPQP